MSVATFPRFLPFALFAVLALPGTIPWPRLIGAIGLIVARRKEDGRSGHIVVVLPESDALRARRNAAGEVVAPVQSQAGATNFERSLGRAGWWNGEQFAESAFWLHA